MSETIEHVVYDVMTARGAVRVEPYDLNRIRIRFTGTVKINGVAVQGYIDLQDYGTGYVRQRDNRGSPYHATWLRNAAGDDVPHKTQQKAIELACDVAETFAKLDPAAMRRAGALAIREDRNRIEDEIAGLRDSLARAEARYEAGIKQESFLHRAFPEALREAQDRDAAALAEIHPASTVEALRERLHR